MDYMAQVDAAARSERERRVLLVMPPGIARAAQPHLGLGIIATRLSEAGFAPLVVDYAYKHRLPAIERFLERFQPAVVGISVFSQHLSRTKAFTRRVKEAVPETPIVLGGPHVTICESGSLRDLKEAGATCLVQGEAEDRIVEVIEGVRSGSCDDVTCAPASLDRYAWPDFGLFVGGLELITYPQQLSRGCPFQCIFCNVKRIAGRRFRTRSIADAIAELKDAVRRYPHLQFVKITDDAPNAVPGRIEQFLETYISERIGPRLEIMQLRADNLTPSIARLLRSAGAPYVVIGVESGDEGVFASVKKGEKLEDIRRACANVKAAELPLVMCFVLGLPASSRETDARSLAFAREMAPAHCYWNVAQPMPGTEMYDYFARAGRILSPNVAEESSLGGNCHADTETYPAIDRLRMQVVAQASTNEVSRNWPYFMYRGTKLRVLPKVLSAMTLPRPAIPRDVERRW